MKINVHELPFRAPRLTIVPIEHRVVALADPDDLTVCLNSMAKFGHIWEDTGIVELRIEAIIVHETLHVLLNKLEGDEVDKKLDGNNYCPIDSWVNDYAISRPVGVVYPGHRGFWRQDDE